MRRARFFITIAILSLSLFVATSPVFASNGNGNGNGGAGNCDGNGNKCSPGNPVLPEAPLAILLPIVGLAVVGLVLFVVYRRRQHALDMAAE